MGKNHAFVPKNDGRDCGESVTRADAIIAADTPGVRPANVKLYDYKNIIRPIFPLDPDMEFDGCWPK